MVRPVLALLLLTAITAAARFARSGLAHWREQSAGQPYGLPGDHRRSLLHGGGAVVAVLCAAALLVALERTATRTAAHQAPTPTRPVPTQAPPQVRSPAVTPTATGAGPAPGGAPRVAFTILGHPAGGELLQASLPDAAGTLRTVHIWLPPQYAEDTGARFPVVVLQSGTPGSTADDEAPYVFDGFATATEQSRAVPFVVVAPQAPPGTEYPCDLLTAAPEAVPDDPALRAVVSSRFRTRPPGPQGWRTLGLGAAAPCAAAAGLARPDLYGAAAALSGRYDTEALTAAAADGRTGPAAPRLLLAAARRDTEGRSAARTLRDALRGADGRAGTARVRLSEVARDFDADRERIRLVRLAVRYLADARPDTPQTGTPQSR
ncbi:hypothetical protein ACIQGZ_03010 [Streptomyces sp. NPDC092296]|uniref:hypothetical protein n=1 Tax=Streptomyces sp. NPDC092296 TaxID=3366012 RepID=UPI0038200112